MTRTKGRKTSRARRKEEPLASSTVNKSASSKDDIKSSSSGTTDKLATSNTIDEAVDRKKSRKTKKSRKRRMIAALYQPQTASTSAMVLSSASSNNVEEPAVSDTAATSRVAAPSVSSDYGTLSILSSEILLMILAELEYPHLKVCTMVSKSVSSLLEHSCFDRTLFRRVNPLKDCNGITPVSIPELKDFTDHEKTWVEVHPALSMMSYGCSPDLEDPRFYDYSDSASPHDDRAVIETSAATEYATMPALQKLKIRIYNRPATVIMNKKGVTVRNVLEALVSHFGTEMRGVMLYDVCPWIEKYEKNRPATYQDAQSRNGWHGFEGQSMGEDGTLVLVADSFDS